MPTKNLKIRARRTANHANIVARNRKKAAMDAPAQSGTLESLPPVETDATLGVNDIVPRQTEDELGEFEPAGPRNTVVEGSGTGDNLPEAAAPALDNSADSPELVAEAGKGATDKGLISNQADEPELPPEPPSSEIPNADVQEEGFFEDTQPREFDGSEDVFRVSEVVEDGSFETASPNKPDAGPKIEKPDNATGEKPDLNTEDNVDNADAKPTAEELKSKPGTVSLEQTLSPENKGFFNKMSAAGQKLFSRFRRIPSVDGAIGKMQIAYHGFWADQHEKDALWYNDAKTLVDTKIASLDQSINGIRSAVDELQKIGVADTGSFLLKIKELERQKQESMAERDTVQSELEASLNKRSLFTNRRDAIADRVINRYNEALEPMEQELRALDTDKDQLNLEAEVTSIKHAQQLEGLNKIEGEQRKIIEALRLGGMSESNIEKFPGINNLSEHIVATKKKLNDEKEALAEKRHAINEKIAAANERANPYRDRREVFARIKTERPIEIKTESRLRRSGVNIPEETIIDGQSNEFLVEPTNGGRFAEIVRNLKARNERAGEQGIGAQENTESDSIPTLNTQIEGWNDYIAKKFPKDARAEAIKINKSEFTKITRLSGNNTIDIDALKRVMARYYKFIKVPTTLFDKEFDNFAKKKLNNK